MNEVLKNSVDNVELKQQTRFEAIMDVMLIFSLGVLVGMMFAGALFLM